MGEGDKRREFESRRERIGDRDWRFWRIHLRPMKMKMKKKKKKKRARKQVLGSRYSWSRMRIGFCCCCCCCCGPWIHCCSPQLRPP